MGGESVIMNVGNTLDYLYRRALPSKGSINVGLTHSSNYDFIEKLSN